MTSQVVSTKRSELMALAIVFIMVFHSFIGGQEVTFWQETSNMLNVGVDIFLFVSGLGCFYSLSKEGRWWPFYRKRLRRLLPAYLLVAVPYYAFMSPLPKGLGAACWTFVYELSTLKFWAEGMRTFWFVPAILGFYAVAPFFFRLLRRDVLSAWALPVVVILLDVMVGLSQRGQTWPTELWSSRLPIFLFGMLLAPAVKSGRRLTVWMNVVLALLLAVGFAGAVGYGFVCDAWHLPIVVQRMSYIPFTVGFVFLVSQLLMLEPRWLSAALTYLGGFTLELYLVHVSFAGRIVGVHNTLPTLLLFFAVSFALAWPVHWVSKKF
jgi:peptidoglycan/LPS O-acetylase OafA/YrhL